MKHHVQRGPLITSGLILLLLTSLIYLTSTSADGSLWGSIGTLIVGMFKTMQLLIALAIAFLFSLAVLVAIFLGAVALVNPDTASRMLTGLNETVSSWFAPFVGQVQARWKSKTQAATEKLEREMRAELRRLSTRMEQEVQSLRQDLTSQVGALASRLDTLEEEAVAAASHQDLVQLAEKMDDLTNRLNSLQQETIHKLQEQLDGLAHAASTEARPTVPEAESSPAPRIFSYLEDPEDRRKLQQLVAANINKDMTYAKFMDFLAKELGGKAGESLRSHPSLLKEYIRQCRQG